ncbi:MAG: type II toxin-antitoxin system HicA family toxin [Nitrospirota bacterium]
MKRGKVSHSYWHRGFLVATKGSHRQFKHQTKPGRVTVAGKPSDDLPPGTLNSIFKQAGWRKGAN